jgi:TRAP-type C4-dicarboxylate transport system substrate-binding protein
MCDRLAPSMRILHVLGLLQNRAEATFVLRQLRPLFDEEMRASGYVALTYGNFGPTIFFSQTPVTSMDEMRKVRWWIWSLEPLLQVQLAAIGVPFTAGGLPDAAPTLQRGEANGLIVIPSATLAYQWNEFTKYFMDLRAQYLGGCLTVARRTFEAQPVEVQQALRIAGLRLSEAFERISGEMDRALIGGLFQKQGIKQVQPSDMFRSQFLETARQARLKLGEQLVPRALLLRVQSLLADLRAIPDEK